MNTPTITKDIIQDTALTEFNLRGVEYSPALAAKCLDPLNKNNACPDEFRKALIAAGEKVSALYSDTLFATNNFDFDWNMDFMLFGTRAGIKEHCGQLFNDLSEEENGDDFSSFGDFLSDEERDAWMMGRNAFADSILDRHTISMSGKDEASHDDNMMKIGFHAIFTPDFFCREPLHLPLNLIV